MPELPEVVHHSEKLSDIFKFSKLDSIIIHNGPYLTSDKDKYSNFRDLVSNYEPHLVKDVKTKGKYMYFLLEGKQHYALGIHHGMEGSWCDNPENKHVILELKSSDNKKIFFQDSRRFGTFSLLSKEQLTKKLNELGPDVFYELEDLHNFQTLVKTTKKIQNKMLCEVIVDQSFISGIGNYLRADIMYQAKLNPHRIINSLSDEELENLFSAMKFVLKKSYEAKATTTGNYISSIHNGSYEYLIYSKKSCPLGGEIVNFKDKNKRTVWWVPTHQK